MKPKQSYNVIYERDPEGLWVATVSGIAGCHTQGRTIEQARGRAREAIQACLDLSKPYDGELVDEVRLPAPVRRVVDSANAARAQAESAERAAAERSKQAIERLTELGLSLRDAGTLLGLSRQRAQQLKPGPVRTGSRGAQARTSRVAVRR
jgi:predicted RNase H-like HicB family nuclease